MSTHMVVESDGFVIHKIRIVLDTGERLIPRDPSAATFQREDGAWMVGWGVGAAGPFPSRALADAVAREMAISPRPS
jgi:hypothetical protein